MSKVTMPPVSVIVESDYELRWVGAEPIAQLVTRTGARVGSVFITTDQAEAYKDACVREALEDAASLCESRAGIRGTGAWVALTAAADEIRALIPQNDSNRNAKELPQHEASSHNS